MSDDDFVRIKYMRDEGDRKVRSSISVDTDLFFVFVAIRGNVASARSTLRAWAVEIDERRNLAARIGVSRMVQRRMYGEIRSFVEKGIEAFDAEGVNRENGVPRRVRDKTRKLQHASE